MALQRALTALGFDTRGADGRLGPRTRGAIAGWQQSHRQEPTGYLTPLQRDLILAEAVPKLAALEAARTPAPGASPAEPAVGVFTNRPLEPGRTFRDCPDCPEMVVVPAGSFQMGSPAGEFDSDEHPRHPVTIAAPFAVGVYEVTFAEWDGCVAGGGCNGYRPHDMGWGRGRQPVIRVSWNDTRSYVEWLSSKTRKRYRLLSEAEWEYVSRAGTTTAYWWGNEIGKGNANCIGCGSAWDKKQPAPVGSFRANPWGLYDVHSNVREWVQDCWHSSYRNASSNGSACETNCEGSARVVRGGSWVNFPWDLRSAFRLRFGPDFQDNILGFRVARALTP